MLAAMKFNVAASIVHRQQETNFSCGAASVAMLLGVPESIVIPLVGCNAKGTYDSEVLRFLQAGVAKSHMAFVNKEYHEVSANLERLSLMFPFYCSATYLWKNPGRGRPCVRHHASLWADGMIYDPSEDRETDVTSYERVFNKKLTIHRIVVVEVERPNFLKNFKRFEDAA